MRVKMESFDLLQYFYGRVHEPLIHGLFRLSAPLDEQALKKAVTLSARAVPLIFCVCDLKNGRPRWEARPFSGEDAVRVVPAGEDEDGVAASLLASPIDITREPQLKVFVVRGSFKDSLLVIMNHMACDGSGFKAYLRLLCGLYTGLLNDPAYDPGIKPVPRGSGQLFLNFSLAEKVKILFLKYDLSALKRQTRFRLEGDKNMPLMLTRRIESDGLSRMRAYAKRKGATVNDMALCAYARALARKTGRTRVVIPCPMDLRKYRPEAKDAVCNLTSNYFLALDIDAGAGFDETLSAVTAQMQAQKRSAACLKSVVMLETAFRLLPYRLLSRSFSRLFTIPVLSYTNLGTIDKGAMRFGGVETTAGYITGAIKYAPYFQIAVSTFDGVMTLSCNFYGTVGDQAAITDFLEAVCRELGSPN